MAVRLGAADRLYGGFFDHVLIYRLRSVLQVVADGLTPQLLLQIGLAIAVIVLWLSDGDAGRRRRLAVAALPSRAVTAALR